MWISLEEAMKELNISRSTLFRKIKNNSIESKKVDGIRLVFVEGFVEGMEQEEEIVKRPSPKVQKKSLNKECRKYKPNPMLLLSAIEKSYSLCCEIQNKVAYYKASLSFNSIFGESNSNLLPDWKKLYKQAVYIYSILSSGYLTYELLMKFFYLLQAMRTYAERLEENRVARVTGDTPEATKMALAYANQEEAKILNIFTKTIRSIKKLICFKRK